MPPEKEGNLMTWRFHARMLRSLAVIVLAVWAVVLVGAASAQSARQLAYGDTVTGALDGSTFAQVFTFNAGAGDTVNITGTSSTDGQAIGLILSDANGQVVQQSTGAEGGDASLQNVIISTSGVYYITVVRNLGGDAVEFSLTLQGTGGATATATTITVGNLDVTLSWNSSDDLNLEVRDPAAGSVNFRTPTSDTGGILSANINEACEVDNADAPAETITYSGDIPGGSYEIIVYYAQVCRDTAQPVNFTVDVAVDGTAVDTINATLDPDGQYVASFLVNAADNIEVLQGGTNPLLVNLTPFSFEITNAAPFGTRSSVAGLIKGANVLDAFTFDGVQGESLLAQLNRTSGSLDTFLLLLGPDRTIITSNDDADDTTTDSVIFNQILPANGTYTLIVTRFGLNNGGTEGNYTLSVSGINSVAAAANTPATDTASTPDAAATPGTPVVAATPAPASGNIPAGLPAGNIEVLLTWNSRADLRLLLRDPQGRSLFSDTPNLPSGGTLARQDNFNCQNQTAAPATYMYYPTDLPLPPGTFEVQVWLNSQCNDTVLPQFTLIVNVRGEELINVVNRPDLSEDRDHYVVSFTINQDGTAVAGEGGLFTGDPSLDIVTLNDEELQDIAYGSPVIGAISPDNPFDVYSFPATAGARVRIQMRGRQGNLDSVLFLRDSAGTLLAVNDDVRPGPPGNNDINSQIEFTIPATDDYEIVATRYGAVFGGTLGEYELSVVQLNR
jgi:hypothetical protein